MTRDSEPAKQMQNVSKFPALKGCAQKRVAIPNGWSVNIRSKMGVFFFTIRKGLMDLWFVKRERESDPWFDSLLKKER